MQVTLETMASVARDFVTALPKSRGSRAHVVGLKGDLGAGKTTFVQHIARELGVSHAVTSPTYVLVEVYTVVHPPFTSLVHIDAYRLEPDEAHTIGWDEYLKNPGNLVLVEWPERLGDAFPKDAPVITLDVVDGSTRTMSHA